MATETIQKCDICSGKINGHSYQVIIPHLEIYECCGVECVFKGISSALGDRGLIVIREVNKTCKA